MAIFHPPLHEQELFATPLEDGERRIRDVLAQRLDDRWHVFVQPHLLNHQPDFLLVAQHHGATVLEVKDWRPGGLQAVDGRLEVSDSAGAWHLHKQDPISRVHQYRVNVAENFLTPPGSPTMFGDVRACVVMPRWNDAEADRVLKAGSRLEDDVKKWIYVAGEGAFDTDRLFDAMVHGSKWRAGRGLDDHVFRRFLARLEEPEAIAEQRTTLKLNAATREIAENTLGRSMRRVRGAAGSGKTLALAARAGNLARENKRVLVVTFNITLAHYIQGLVRRWCRRNGGDHRLVDCIHIHGFTSDVRGQVGSLVRYDDSRLENDRDPNVSSEVRRQRLFDNMIRQAEMCYEQHGDMLDVYDAVLVDEGQDFKLFWWTFLRDHVVRGDNPEMLLAADVSQDIYERKSWTQEGPMLGAGFRGQWRTLKESYRLPVDYIPIIREFASEYLEADSQHPLIPFDTEHARSSSTIRRWVNVGAATATSLNETVREELDRMLAHDGGPHAADVVILCERHATGRAVMDHLQKRGHTSEHIFAADNEEQQNRKYRFWPGISMLKGSTTHSFKGWESRGVILIIEDTPASSPELVYTALTRVKGDPAHRSAFVTVINASPRYSSFKATFERTVTLEEIAVLLVNSLGDDDRPVTQARVRTSAPDSAMAELDMGGLSVTLIRSENPKAPWPLSPDLRLEGRLIRESAGEDGHPTLSMIDARVVQDTLF